MAGEIKGITIEFRGDTTKLDKALKQINSESRSTNRSLKEVNNALKFNPTNTTLLAQKQELLSKRVTETKDKLNALKDAQKKMDAAGVDKNSQEYQKLSRQIIVAENQLKNFTAQARKAAGVKLQALGEKFQQIGTKIKTAGDTLSKTLTPALAGIGAGSLAAFDEVDGALDTVEKKTGASGTALSGMEDTVKKLATTIPTSFETAGNAVGEVNTRFGLTGSALEKLSGQFIKFAELNGTDVSTSIDQVQKAMAAYNVPTKNASSYMDMLNKVGQATGISMDTLTGSLTANAPALTQMGLNSKQAAAMVGNLEKAGVDSGSVMAGLKKALKNAADEGKPMGVAMAEMGKSIKGAKTDQEAITRATKLFGAKAGPAIATAVRSGKLNFKSLADTASISGDTVAGTFKKTEDPIDKWKTTLNKLKLTGAEVGSSLGTVLAPMLEKVGAAAQKLANWFGGLNPKTQELVVKIGLAAGAAGPLLSIIGRMGTGIGTLMKVIAPLAGALFGVVPAETAAGTGATVASGGFMGLNIALGPLLITIGLIVAAIIGVILIFKNWDKIVKVFKATIHAFGKVFSTIGGGIKKAAGGMKDAVGTAFKTMGSKVKSAGTAIKNGVKTAFNNSLTIVKAVGKGMVENSKRSLANMKSAYKNAGGGIKGIVAAMRTGVYEHFKNLYNGLNTLTGGKFGQIVGKVRDKMGSMRDAIAGFGGRIKDAFRSLFSNIHIPLPHFSLKKSQKTLMGKTIEYPSGFSVDWYKTGGIFNRPSVIGVGEAGKEAVVPLSGSQMRPFAQAIAAEMHTGKTAGNTTIWNVTLDISNLKDLNNLDDFVKMIKRAKAFA